MTNAAVALVVLGAAACTEAPQTAGTRKIDNPNFQGANNLYVVPGWNVGNATSWDQQLTQRAQSQNEYARIGSR